MIVVAVTVPIRAGFLQKAQPIMEKMAYETQQEPGCVFYEFYTHIADKNSVLVYEEWRDDAALQTHKKTPHMEVYIRDMKDLLGGPMSARRHETR